MNDEQTPHNVKPANNTIQTWVTVYKIAGLILFSLLSYRLYHLQIVKNDAFTEQQTQQTISETRVPASRGEIRDRNNRILATSTMELSVFADPGLIANPQSTAKQLTKHLQVSEDQLLQKLQKKNDRFVWVKRYVTEKQARTLRALNLPGIAFKREYKRKYPQNQLAAHTLGFVGAEQKGLAGIEYFFQDQLHGKPGHFLSARDALNNTYRFLHWKQPPRSGDQIRLTLDVRTQSIVEDELDALVRKHNPKWVSAIMMDSHTGEIIALANKPGFSPESSDQSSRKTRRNHVITSPVEPGSVFKPVVMAAALEENKLSADETIYCEQGSFNYRGRTLHDYSSFGKLSSTGVLANSSNIGMAKIGLRLKDDLRTWVKRFGFGDETGIELPGEESGFVQTAERWNPIYTQTSVPMGHEILVTPLQMVRAFTVFASGGEIVNPTLIHPSERTDEPNRKKLLSANTQQTVQNMLRTVVTSGTATTIRDSSVAIAGKTGTSRKYNDEDKHFSSFIGMAPHPKSRYVLGVFVNEPDGVQSGGKVAAPAVKRIFEQAKPYLEWPHDGLARGTGSTGTSP